MLSLPKAYKVTAGSSEGESVSGALRAALLEAGISDIKLMRVDNKIPPNAVYNPDLEIPTGVMVPTCYCFVDSKEAGQIISAAIGVGIAENGYGIIKEYAGNVTKEEAEEEIQKKLEEEFRKEGLIIADVKIASTQHTVEKYGCSVATVPFWNRD
ncbi:MAG: pyruvoyl-dependent arginine decarboxylase [Clostridia bacterium]|nr:pyruvoyl-dependent arginine decarboxylase [Clostridia bacterium]